MSNPLSTRKFCRAISIVTMVCLLAGCGGDDGSGPRVVVSGRVTLDDQPFSGASIWFTSPVTGASQFADLQSDGTYSLKIESAHLNSAYPVFFAPLQGAEHQPVGQYDGAGEPLPPPMPQIPGRYLDGSTSGLQITLTNKQPHTFDVELTSAP